MATFVVTGAALGGVAWTIGIATESVGARSNALRATVASRIPNASPSPSGTRTCTVTNAARWKRATFTASAIVSSGRPASTMLATQYGSFGTSRDVTPCQRISGACPLFSAGVFAIQ